MYIYINIYIFRDIFSIIKSKALYYAPWCRLNSQRQNISCWYRCNCLHAVLTYGLFYIFENVANWHECISKRIHLFYLAILFIMMNLDDTIAVHVLKRRATVATLEKSIKQWKL